MKGFYYNYIINKFVFIHQNSIDYKKIDSILNKEKRDEFIHELNRWCYEYKDVMSKIDLEKLEELSQWDDKTDRAFIKDKYFIDDITELYKKQTSDLEKYMNAITLDELFDAYQKTKMYEPGMQKNITIISNMLKKGFKNQNFEEEADSPAFYNVKELGQGAFGKVRLITTNSIVFGDAVKVAVKTIFDKTNDKEINKRQLESEKRKREYLILNSIDHPNIMKVYFKWITSKNMLKIASEYLPCRDLRKLLKIYSDINKTRGLPLELVRFFAVEMIKALSYMRSNKILHRDIKPDNVILDHSFHIKLANFELGLKYDENDTKSINSKMYDECREVKDKSETLKNRVFKIKNEIEHKLEKEKQNSVFGSADFDDSTAISQSNNKLGIISKTT